MNSQLHGNSSAPQPEGNGNAILVNGELVDALMASIKEKRNTIDRIPSKRDVLDHIIPKMVTAFNGHYVYSRMARKVENVYKWFDSEVVRRIQSNDEIRDKGRFVDACIIGYLKGEPGLRKLCIASRLILPRDLSQEESANIARAASEMDALKRVDSAFVPGTHQGEILSKIEINDK